MAEESSGATTAQVHVTAQPSNTPASSSFVTTSLRHTLGLLRKKLTAPRAPSPSADPALEAPSRGPGGAGSGGTEGEEGLGDDVDEEEGTEEGENLPFPMFAPTAFFLLGQTTRPRNWCIAAINWPYPFWKDCCILWATINGVINNACCI